MRSILNAKLTSQFQNYEQSGYFNNIKTALQFAPSVNLLPFFFRVHRFTDTLPEGTKFELIGLDCKGNEVLELDLDASKIHISTINDQIIVQYNADADLISGFASFQQGIYKYRITLSTDRVYDLEPFKIDYSKFIPILGDFDPLDFNADFFTTG